MAHAGHAAAAAAAAVLLLLLLLLMLLLLLLPTALHQRLQLPLGARAVRNDTGLARTGDAVLRVDGERQLLADGALCEGERKGWGAAEERERSAQIA